MNSPKGSLHLNRTTSQDFSTKKDNTVSIAELKGIMILLGIRSSVVGKEDINDIEENFVNNPCDLIAASIRETLSYNKLIEVYYRELLNIVNLPIETTDSEENKKLKIN